MTVSTCWPLARTANSLSGTTFSQRCLCEPGHSAANPTGKRFQVCLGTVKCISWMCPHTHTSIMPCAGCCVEFHKFLHVSSDSTVVLLDALNACHECIIDKQDLCPVCMHFWKCPMEIERCTRNKLPWSALQLCRFQDRLMSDKEFNLFTPKSDWSQISPAASPEILYSTTNYEKLCFA